MNTLLPKNMLIRIVSKDELDFFIKTGRIIIKRAIPSVPCKIRIGFYTSVNGIPSDLIVDLGEISFDDDMTETIELRTAATKELDESKETFVIFHCTSKISFSILYQKLNK